MSSYVIVYDGECSFCQKQVSRMQRLDAESVFEYTPRQTEGLEERFPKLAEGDFNTGMRLVRPDGRIDVGADAVYEIARRLSVWKRFAWLYRVPIFKQIARLGYGMIAKYRYKLARRCDNSVCEVTAAREPRA